MTISGGDHYSITLYGDAGSYLHSALGYFAARSGWFLMISLAFIAYQVSNNETRDVTSGDIFEYLLGACVGLLTY